MEDKHKYDDIIDLPHHVSAKHPPLGRDSYAAQFSPFAALTGYDGVVEEAARTTDQKIELGEYGAAALDEKLRALRKNEKDRPTVTLTYFRADGKKAGGSYEKKTARLKRIDEAERTVLFTDGTAVKIDDVLDVTPYTAETGE
ncbi:MAG: hypothetical protein J5879_04610 [Clostridia bacterium]|nr:hypothetical protein [Clostridia bacterium]